MAIIRLPYGAPGETFDSDDLVAHILSSGRDYIIQGQVACVRAHHPKPHSLDCWLRDNSTRRHDVKQAVNAVIEDLIATGQFQEGIFHCPDSGRYCQGIRLTPQQPNCRNN